MSAITLDSHDTLGKLSIIKNYLSVVLEDQTLSASLKEHLKRAFEANEALISVIKEKTSPSVA